MAYTKICFFFSLMMAFLGGSTGTLYEVGDAAGWNNNGTDYESWASSKKFYLGDSIVFNYKPGKHNVLQATKEDYEACSTTLVLATYTSGRDSILFYSPGDYYFLCSYRNMCQQGQKIEIKVSPTTNPNPTPVTNPTPPGGNSQPGTYPYYLGFSAASTTHDFYHHLWLVFLLHVVNCGLTFYRS